MRVRVRVDPIIPRGYPCRSLAIDAGSAFGTKAGVGIILLLLLIIMTIGRGVGVTKCYALLMMHNGA